MLEDRPDTAGTQQSDLPGRLREVLSRHPVRGRWELTYTPTEFVVAEDEIFCQVPNSTLGVAMLLPRTVARLAYLGPVVGELHAALTADPGGAAYRLLHTPASAELPVKPGQILIQGADPERRRLLVHAVSATGLQAGHVVHAALTVPLTIPPSEQGRAPARLLEPVYVKDPSNGFHLMGDRSARADLPVSR
jgi:hypothetical protein